MIVYLFAYLHHIVAFILVTIVLLQNILLSEFPDQKTIRQLRFLDTLYGVSAVLILIIGFSRVYAFEKGPEYYFSTLSFGLKMAIFTLVGLLSIYPTLIISKWNQSIKVDSDFKVELINYSFVRRIKRIELALLFFVPFFAILMAKGVK